FGCVDRGGGREAVGAGERHAFCWRPTFRRGAPSRRNPPPRGCGMTRRASRIFRSVLFLGCSLLAAPAALRAQDAQSQSWLDDVDPLITPREREVYLSLKTPADREAFVQRFWQMRDPYLETPRNEARERWEERLKEAKERWSDPKDDRRRVFLLNGEP